ncbi:hypothetical protein GAH_01014 [Geoglobus ahangari]|uniref:Uncharacterized protein n=1 Tax=Geoglobus ahangari TaxID=113653 RepID=A0A0F7IGB3_9EURY|nr:hypothetical protein [Geoglobus ahangari]AKG91662.1 hypothetical protein GAH_01014 [Geoglobus ahangari]
MLRELMEFDRIINFIAKKMDELDIVIDSEVYKINRSDDRDLELFEKILDALKSSSIRFRDNFDQEIFIETAVYSAKT